MVANANGQFYCNLRLLGFSDYQEYLRSDFWRVIRNTKLRMHSSCWVCKKRATLVHHRSYDLSTLKGDSFGSLVSLCRGCHNAAHRNKRGKKQSLNESNNRLQRHKNSVNAVHKVRKTKGGRARRRREKLRWWRQANANWGGNAGATRRPDKVLRPSGRQVSQRSPGQGETNSPGRIAGAVVGESRITDCETKIKPVGV